MNAAAPLEEQFAQQLAALPARAARQAALERFARTGLPHRRMEGWRWSDVRAALARKTEAGGRAVPRFAAPHGALRLHFADGRLDDAPALPDGLRLRMEDAPANAGLLHMADLASALAPVGHVLRIDAAPQQVLHLDFTGAGHARLDVQLAAGVRVVIVEDHQAPGGFANAALTYDLGEGAALTRLVRQAGGAGAVHVVSANIRLERTARLCQFSLGFGARLARLDTRLDHGGPDSFARLNGAYLLGGERHGDQTYYADHAHPDCKTAQLVRGAVADSAHAVFQGKFYVARGSQHTDAQMAHDAVLLHDGASVNAKPELEIYADDVICTHGNTCGALDESALFYMRQRGLDDTRARALLVRGFIGAAFDDLGDEALHALMMTPVESWLEDTL